MNTKQIGLSVVVMVVLAAQASAGGPPSARGLVPLPRSTFHWQTQPPPKPWITPEKKAIAKFVNANSPRNAMPILPYMVVESGKANIGGGKYDTLVLLDISGRGYSNTLCVYHRNNAGKFSEQDISGWKMGNLRQMVRDLNGDGIDELIISESLGPMGQWQPMTGMPTWPAIYRLENGTYVEASRDFPSYYDTEVLPSLDKAIAWAQSRELSDSAAVSILVKDKILRMLGRNPVAGLNHAYRWMNSDDPTLMQCALATFKDIGGHQQEVQELQKALPGAVTRAIEKSKSPP